MTTTAPPPSSSAAPAPSLPKRLWNAQGPVRLRREGALAPILAFVIFLVVYIIINPELLTRFQLQTAANLVVPLALAALGQMIIVLTGGIDISIGAIMSLSTMAFMPTPLALLCGIAAGLACGLFNGLLVAYGRLPAIAVTLASSFIFASLSREIMDRPGGGVTTEFYLLTSGELLPFVPMSIVWLTLIGVGLWFVLQRTSFGRHIYGVGSNADSVRSAGINDRRATVGAFALSGVVVALGGIMLAGSTITGAPRSGDPYLLTSIAAVALAGVSFAGGKGSIIGTILAAFTLGLVGSLLFFAGINSYWQYVISALIVIAVVAIPVIWSKVSTAAKGARA